MLAVPHAAFAIGLAFLIAPSGWLLRLLSPWATGFEAPPPWPTTQDPWGLGLIAVLVAKEVPFLLWMAATQLQRAECLDAAVRAGHWLAAQQDADGCFRRFEHHDTPHVYNTRATWPLLATGLLAGEPRLVDAARRHMDWALTQQTASGWFATNAFVPSRSPFTHTIAYAIRGLLEAGVLLGEARYLDAALKAGRGLAAQQRGDGWLAGTYRDGWVADAGYACLTGIAQMSLNWTRLAQAAGADELRANARRAIAYLKTTQRLQHPNPAVEGGIAGSAPIWGDYSRFEYPNWAAKFFADALMMDLADIAVPPVPAALPVPTTLAMPTTLAPAAGGPHG
jgi:hypothetical protein